MGLTPNGNTSLKPRQGRSWKRARRIDIVARLESKFCTDAEIAAHLGLTVAAIQAIKNSPEYTAKRVALANNHLSVYDAARLSSEEALKDELDDLMPLAVQSVRNILHDPTHPHHAKVVLDLLDRNKATSKISRMEHSVAPPKDNVDKNKQANELMGLLAPDDTVNNPDYDPLNPLSTPNPYKKLPEFVPLPDQDPNVNPEDIVPEEELNKAIEKNKDINDLIM